MEYEIPKEAVAEAIVNAVVHRDYASNASVQVMLFADRLEVWNPGELPPSLTIAGLRKPHASIPHNPLVCEPMFLVRYVEKAGSGILDMIELCRQAKLREPEFRQDGGQFVQTLWRPKSVSPTVAQVEAHEAQVELATIDTAILAACQAGPRTGKELLKSAGYSTRTGSFKRSVEKLLRAGLLELTIPDRPRSRMQKYRLTADGLARLRTRSQRSARGH